LVTVDIFDRGLQTISNCDRVIRRDRPKARQDFRNETCDPQVKLEWDHPMGNPTAIRIRRQKPPALL